MDALYNGCRDCWNRSLYALLVVASLTHHAEERMALRRISREMIFSAIQKPDFASAFRADHLIEIVHILTLGDINIIAKWLEPCFRRPFKTELVARIAE